MKTVTSVENPVIREVKSLKLKKYRDEKGLYFIEGFKCVEEAIDSGAKIIMAFFSEDTLENSVDIDKCTGRKCANAGCTSDGCANGETFSNARYINGLIKKLESCGSEVYRVPCRVFDEISDMDSPQGILAVLKAEYRTLDKLPDDCRFYIMLDSIQDPGNAGTIIRTADAAGAGGVILSKGCVDVYNPKVIRASMGSIFHIPIYTGCDLIGMIKWMRSSGMKVYATRLDGENSCFKADFQGNIAIVVGNESNGICNEVAAACDMIVTVPMPGRAESLNAAVAAGIIIYEAVRQHSVK